MLEINGKKFLNEQEAICYLLNEVQTLKQSLGSALPDPIEGPEGPTGPTGATGPQGERGTGVFGCSSVLPSPTAYKDGDFYVLFNGNLYKKVAGNWILQTNLKGPQGPVGLEGGSEVVANPAGDTTDNLYKVEIDGTIYEVLSTIDRQKLGLITYLGGNWLLTSPVILAANTIIYTGKYLYNDGTIDSTVGNIKVTDLSQIKDSSNNPIVICENFKDANNNVRFVSGDLSTSPISGITFTYAKWSLSGSHIMFVLCGEVAANTTLNVDVWASVTLPDYIKNKISGVFASTNIEVKDSRAYYDDWNSINIQTVLQKTSDGIKILMIQNPTSTAIAHFRIQYDLLIDMD